MAANTGIIHGGDILLYYSTDDGATWTPFAHETSNTINHGESEVKQVSSKTLGPTPQIKIGKDGLTTINLNALRTYDGENYFSMHTMKKDRTRLQVKIAGVADPGVVMESNEQVGDTYLEGYGYITALSCENPHDSESTIQATITMDGDFEQKTVAA